MLYGYNLAVVNSPAQVRVTVITTDALAALYPRKKPKHSHSDRTDTLFIPATHRVKDQVVYFMCRRVGVYPIVRLLEPHCVIDVLWILPVIMCSAPSLQCSN